MIAALYDQCCMTSLLAGPKPRIRPDGVRTLAIGCFLIAGYLTVNAVLVFAGVLSLASGSYLLGEYTTMGPILFLLIAWVLAGLGTALWRGWRWARRAAIVPCGFLIALSVIPVSSAVIDGRVLAIFLHGAKIILAIVCIRYLLQPEVVDYFSA
jgi:hypothetical protein